MTVYYAIGNKIFTTTKPYRKKNGKLEFLFGLSVNDHIDHYEEIWQECFLTRAEAVNNIGRK